MENLALIVLVTFIAGVIGTGLGGLISCFFKKDSSKTISLLLSFAAGIMLAIVCFDLLSESLDPLHDNVGVPFYYVLFFTFLGYIFVFFINSFIDKRLSKEVPHTSENHPDLHDNLDEMIHVDHYNHHKNSDNRLFLAGIVMVIVIAVHNLPEGMVIGASYAKDIGELFTNTGFMIAIVIGIHNIPEGMAIAAPLIASGTKKWKAILFSALSGLPIVIGAIIGYLIGMMSPLALSISLSLASGAMLYVVFGELLPESFLMWKSKLPAFILLVGLLLGFTLVLVF